MTTGLGKTFGSRFFSVAQNSYEQDANSTSQTTSTHNNYPVTIAERTPHLRIRSESLSNASSAPSSPNASSPISVSPTAFASFLLPTLFPGTTNTTTNTNQNIGMEDTLPPLHTRRSSQSDTSGQQHMRYIPARRYTLPNLNVWNPTSNEKNQGDSFRVPLAKSWEMGGREDSSVQVAMEHVQFGL